MWKIKFHIHVKLNLMTTAELLTQIDVYNFIYKYDSNCSIALIMLVKILKN